MELQDFIFVEKTIPLEACDSLSNFLNSSSSWVKHSYQTTNSKKLFPPNEFEILDSTEYQSLILIPYIEKAINNYNKFLVENFSFENYIWHCKINQINQIRFNRCRTNVSIDTHYDHIHELFGKNNKSIPVLSVVGLLNDNFTGGDFVLFDKFKVDLKKGDVVLFPSTFLYPHRVEKVLSGMRNSFVTWAY